MSSLSPSEQHELQQMKAERSALIEAFGAKGQRHHMNVDIGGLNPAAQRLHVLRNRIAVLEKRARGEKPVLTPKGSGRGWDRGGGLLYDITFAGRRGMIGRTQGSPPFVYYVVEDGEVTSIDHRTVGAASKAFEKAARR